jgi:hypothetical protein
MLVTALSAGRERTCLPSHHAGAAELSAAAVPGAGRFTPRRVFGASDGMPALLSTGNSTSSDPRVCADKAHPRGGQRIRTSAHTSLAGSRSRFRPMLETGSMSPTAVASARRPCDRDGILRCSLRDFRVVRLVIAPEADNRPQCLVEFDEDALDSRQNRRAGLRPWASTLRQGKEARALTGHAHPTPASRTDWALLSKIASRSNITT